jgi:hypothetical protein
VLDHAGELVRIEAAMPGEEFVFRRAVAEGGLQEVELELIGADIVQDEIVERTSSR